ncbi:tryptophan aminotransferase-related protein 3-like [Punica granatum]|uniref:Uncharacterized protein n=2 Tax=Punica granatum TaxID=22663 RepID=A0A218XQD9_PUNGR|nr:tryptophan aminotransferase-related protein 3-like [Punica granatum]OWM87018.1 hypothetical protein CDL15_Pgr016055 [Punica granatum]PKI35463.1 hypothetical protein CRG98_044149 [Punica granatum]
MSNALKYILLFVASSSIILNLLLCIKLFSSDVGNNQNKDQSWSRSAAQEAELAASMDCSGHGRAYLDGIIIDGKPVCECNLCYSGPDCSNFSPDCPADANDGDPYYLEEFWKKHAASSAVMVSGWHRMSYSYSFSDQYCQISEELEKHIRKVHEVVGNAITDGKYIICGAGATQLLNAAVHALSSNNPSIFPTRVVATAPYYKVYQTQTEYFESNRYRFEGEASACMNGSDTTTNIIEFVTSPSNPEGQFKRPVLSGPNVKTIYDRAYYWPNFTPIPGPADEDLSIFTISKLTGHAGSRFGWALVKDKEVYERMTEYLNENTVGISKDTQLRMLKILKVVLEDGSKEMFGFAHRIMKNRWERLRDVLAHSDRFSLQQTPAQYCTFTHGVREPTPAYAWLKCEKEEDENCSDVLRSANIIGRKGDLFNADNHYVRLSLIRTEDDFDNLINRLHKMVNTKPRVLDKEKDHARPSASVAIERQSIRFGDVYHAYRSEVISQ